MGNLTGRQLILIATAVLALAAISIGVYGLVRGPAAAPPRTDTADIIQLEPTVDIEPLVVSPEQRTLPRTTDPIQYSRAIATALFEWDTSAGLLPTDYTSTVLADADPSGEETSGLIADVATYLPTIEQWLDLGSMEVTQTLTVETAAVPGSWATAVQQARGHLRPGTTAITITGTRHRSGIWNGEKTESWYDVSFTVFVACPPAFDRCHVLRLSQLDNPLR